MQEMPQSISLTAFKFYETGHVFFAGESLQSENVSGLVRRLEESPVLHKCKIDFFNEKLVDDQKVYSFGIKAQLQTHQDLGKSGDHD